MQRKERSSSIFYSKANFFEGYLQKSPPINRFTTLTSWKKRYFIISKESDEYVLKYYKTQEDTAKPLGAIHINGIIEMDVGPQNHAKWKIIEKMFKCSRESVIFLKTEGRDYFFIGDGEDVKKLQQEILNLKNISPVQDPLNFAGGLDETMAYLLPEATTLNTSHGIYSTISDASSEVEEKTGGDPKPPPRLSDDPVESIYDVPKNMLAVPRPHSDVLVLTSLTTGTVVEEKLRASSTSAVHSETFGDTYDTPRNLLAACRSYDSGIYMSMASISEVKDEERSRMTTNLNSLKKMRKLSSTEDLLHDVEPVPTQSNAASLKGRTMWVADTPTHMRQPKALNRDTTEEKQLEKLDLTVSQKTVERDLKFSKINGNVCVIDSMDAKCTFCHGDIITAINKLQISEIDELHLFVHKSVEEEVTISILRQPEAPRFHCEKCDCEDETQESQEKIESLTEFDYRF